MDGIPAEMWDLVKGNIVVQWFLVIVFILIVGTNTATKIKGPLGGFARWMRSVGEARENREAEERRQARQKLLQSAQEGREYVEREIRELKETIHALMDERQQREELVDQHLGWDYDRRLQLINAGVPLNDIPPAPPLRSNRQSLPPVPPPSGRHRTRHVEDGPLT